MSMRIFSQQEFDAELMRRGCKEHTDLEDANGFWWEGPNGKFFQVPHPEEEGNPSNGYPDYILDDLIQIHGLPPAPKKH